VLKDKFAGAFARVVDYGSRNESWHPLLQDSLRGIAKNATLAVLPALHGSVARLVSEVSAGPLRDAAQRFLEVYCISATLLKNSLAAEVATTADRHLDPYYFATQPAPPRRDENGQGQRSEDIDIQAFEAVFGKAA
jgi:hypothetical protein